MNYTPPEPTKFIAEVKLWPSGKQHQMNFNGYTESQLRSEVEKARREAIEEAAKVCEDRDSGQGFLRDVEDRECAIAIRNLK